MRYVVFFTEDGKAQRFLHYRGRKLDPDEEVKKNNHPNFKRFSEDMLVDLCGEDFRKKVLFLELDSQGEVVFNEEKYNESLEEEE